MDLEVMALDGLEIAERMHVIALGITTDGVKIRSDCGKALRERHLARLLLAELVDRGLDPEQAILFVIDGSKALREAIRDVFGGDALAHPMEVCGPPYLFNGSRPTIARAPASLGYGATFDVTTPDADDIDSKPCYGHAR